MAEVRPLRTELPTKYITSASSLHPKTDCSISHLRPCRNDLVPAPLHTREIKLSKYYSRCARDCRPNYLRAHKSLRFLEHYGYSRGEGPCEENCQYLCGYADCELDGLATGADSEFQVCATGGKGAVCKFCEFR